MTRSIEIVSASLDSEASKYGERAIKGFIEGAKWADEHPHWNDMSNEPQEYNDFLVITKGGCMDFAHFDRYGWHKSHYDGSSDFLYWTTPPVKPKGGEE
jgi:hypothetical protein